jgi:transposase-like protein
MEAKVVLRYSIAFRQKVVSEIEAGKLTIAHARRVYGIHGSNTIRRWLRTMGNPELLTQVVRIAMTDEPSRVQRLEKEKERLESALAQAHLKIVTLEATLEVLEEKSGMSVKKKIDAGLSKSLSDDKKERSDRSR